jgi:hypothetical protein
MEIKNTFIEGNLDISVESTSLKEEGEPLYNLLLNDDCYTLSRRDWIEIKDFIDNAIDFIDDNN